MAAILTAVAQPRHVMPDTVSVHTFVAKVCVVPGCSPAWAPAAARPANSKPQTIVLLIAIDLLVTSKKPTDVIRKHDEQQDDAGGGPDGPFRPPFRGWRTGRSRRARGSVGAIGPVKSEAE